MMLPESQTPPPAGDTTVYVAAFGEQGSQKGFTILQDLRLAGIRAVADFRSGTLKAHLRQADRWKCRYALMIGDDEVTKGFALLRDMNTKAQSDIPLTAVVPSLKPLISGS